GLSDATKPPIRIGLFGPRGTGKTEAAITYAKAMNLPFKRIEMNQYAQGDPALFLKELGATIRANPYHVVLFDEFEKASIAVQNALLALLDSGFFNVQESGNVVREEKATVKVDARKAVFMLASNAGDDFIRQAFLEASGSQAALSAKTAEENNAAIQKALKSSLTPSMLEQHLMSQGLSGPILDRLQAVLPVFPATAFEFRNVVNLHASRIIDEANKELKDSKISLQFLNQADFVNLVASKFYYPGITNRAALRILQDTLRDQITEAKLAHANEAWNGEFSADLVKVAKQIEEQACDLSLTPKGSKIGFQYGNQK
ncbi:MAG: ATP-dependent Clp protease ATP-binding subunit, partial [Bdellovibrio sp.]|nr:ATP-dependent Clp protease ATP-binding subunit [Bdellovibrio sp.]